MKTVLIKDRYNKAVGYLRDAGNFINVHNMSGARLGYYSKSTDTTHLVDGTKIANANIVVSLLFTK